jgi:hypothetical protein
LVGCQSIEKLDSALDQDLHKLIIYPRQDVFAKKEANWNEISVKVVNSAAILFNVSHNFSENWQLRYIRILSLL